MVCFLIQTAYNKLMTPDYLLVLIFFRVSYVFI